MDQFTRSMDPAQQPTLDTWSASNLPVGFLERAQVIGDEPRSYLINQFSEVGMTDPFPPELLEPRADVPKRLRPMGDIDLPVYPEYKMNDPLSSPASAYLPRKELMLKMMRAAFEVNNESQLWFNNIKVEEEPKMTDVDWELMAKLLPTSQTDPEAILRRKQLWKSFDGNNNGHLSLAEVQMGISSLFKGEAIATAKPAMMRAFQFAKAYQPGKGVSNDFLQENEFRYFLVALRQRFEYWVAFKCVDLNEDGKVDF